MKLDVQVDFKKVEAMLNSKGKSIVPAIQKATLRTAFKGAEIIKSRTAKGMGIESPFAGYSQQYREWKIKKYPRGIVNLHLSGNMMSSMTAKKIRGGAEIYFTRLTEARKAVANNKRRPFFGFSQRERNKLVRFFYRYFE